ncbi:MAG: right-handed parallel beta-helix repeat-containing protein [Victivallales bacterium]
MSLALTLPLLFVNSLCGTSTLLAADEREPPSKEKLLVAIYIDNVNGDDSRNGGDTSSAVKTFKRALLLVAPTGTLHLKNNSEPYRETLALNSLGEEDKPFTVEGNGSTIDLGNDASAGPWEADGDAFVLKGDYGVTTERKALNQKALIFLNGTPLSVPRLYDRELSAALKPGEVNFTADGKLRVRFPEGVSPAGAKIMLPGTGNSCVTVSNSSAVIRNLTVQHAGNDGFGISGKAKTLLLEKVRALWNSDEGISAHGDSRVVVRDSILIGNGSKAGGAFDVDNTVTSYERVLSMRNRNRPIGATNASLTISDCLSIANGNGFPETGKGILTLKNSADFKSMPETVPDNLKKLLELAKTVPLKP